MGQFCTIYLVRHGESEWNVSKRMQGHSDSPLTLTGQHQAKQLAQNLKHIKFSAIYSSDLGRAKETARIIAIEHKLVVVTHQLLRERYFGRLEGRPWLELSVELKDLLAQREALADKDRFTHKLFPEVESDEELVIRLITFIREVSLTYLGQNILVVSHGGIIRALLVHLGFGTQQQLPAGALSNSGYVVLTTDGIDFFIDQVVGVNKQPSSH